MLTTLFAAHRLPGAATALAAACLLAACGGGDNKAPTQAAARVNDKGEITVHQINQVLQQQPGLKPEQVDAASRQVLEKLVDQELALAQATELKLDRQPAVVAALEAARRDVIARAFAEHIASSVAKPTPDDVQKYFNDKPALFSNRRIYELVELNVAATPEQAAEVAERAKSIPSVAEFTGWLSSKGLRASNRRVSQPAENLPLDLVDRLATFSAGQTLVLPAPGGVRVVVVESARAAPVTLEQTRPVIEQFLLNDRKLKAVQAEQQRLRASAKIEYLGKFSAPAASAPAGAEPANPVSPTPAPPESASAPAGGLDANAVKKGLGLK